MTAQEQRRCKIDGAERHYECRTAPNQTTALRGAASRMAVTYPTFACSSCRVSTTRRAQIEPPLCERCYRREWGQKNKDKRAKHRRDYLNRLGGEEVRARARFRRASMSDEINAYARAWKAKNKDRVRARRLVEAAKLRAKKHGLPFSLRTLEALPDNCALCGMQFSMVVSMHGGATHSAPSIDKLIPSLGYTEENTWIICRGCNATKSNATPDFMRRVLAEIDARGLERRPA